MNKFKELRKKFIAETGEKLSQEQLAKKLNVARSTVAMWENGSSFPDIDTLKAIADFFGVSVNYLLSEPSLPTPQKPIDTNRLRELRLSKGLKQAELAAKLNITQGALSGWETGRYSIGNNDLRILANFFGVSIDYLLGEPTLPTPQKLKEPFNLQMFSQRNLQPMNEENKKIPIIGSVKCGTNGLAFEYLEGYIFVGDQFKGEAVAFRCRGDSMIDLGISDGDLAIVRLQDDVECGDLAVVVINGDEGALKRVRKFDGGISLESANAAYPSRIFTGADLSTVKIVGKVLEIRKRF